MPRKTFLEALREAPRYAGIAFLLAFAVWLLPYLQVEFYPALQIFGSIFILKFIYDFENGAFKLVQGLGNFAKKTAIGIALFYALWFLFGQVMGILPVETYRSPLGPWDALWLDKKGLDALGPQMIQTAVLAWTFLALAMFLAFHVAKSERYSIVALVLLGTFAAYAVVFKLPLSAKLWPSWHDIDQGIVTMKVAPSTPTAPETLTSAPMDPTAIRCDPTAPIIHLTRKSSEATIRGQASCCSATISAEDNGSMFRIWAKMNQAYCVRYEGWRQPVCVQKGEPPPVFDTTIPSRACIAGSGVFGAEVYYDHK